MVIGGPEWERLPLSRVKNSGGSHERDTMVDIMFLAPYACAFTVTRDTMVVRGGDSR